MTRYPYAPGFTGNDGTIEELFEKAKLFLKDRGILIILSTNFRSLAYPNKRNIIEEEIRINRRWVLLDYLDTSIKYQSYRNSFPVEFKRLPNVMKEIFSKLRMELWVLHPIEAIPIHGWIHNLPGAKPPPSLTGRYRFRTKQAQQRMVLKQKVNELGLDWGTYKDRLLNLLKEQAGKNEDPLSQNARMLLDPTYPDELAKESQKLVEAQQQKNKEFHESVINTYPIDIPNLISPRNFFDKKNGIKY